MASAKKTQIVITANAAVAKKVMDELQQRIDGIKQKMASLDVTTKQGQKEFKKLEKELVSYNSVVEQNITNEERVKNAIDNLSRTSLKELRRALSSAKTMLGKTFADDPNLKKRQQDVKTLQDQIDKLTGSVHKQSSSWSTAMKNLTAYVGLFAVFNQVKSMITGVIKKNFEMSDSLADIRKVSGLAIKDIEKMATSLAKIDTRTSIDELNTLAYAGAKLGVGTRGIDALESFVRASNQVNVALKEDMGDEALTALSKIVEVMGDLDKLGVEQSMLKVGSSIFKLGATSTATATNIVDFTARLASIAKVSGVTTDELLALGSASDAMFLMPEVSATSFIKAFSSIKTNVDALEKAIHVEPGTLRSLLEAGKGMDAMVVALDAIKDLNATEQATAFKELGSEGARMNLVFTTMSQNVNVLRNHLRTSEKAFRDGIAITEEYNIQQATAQGTLERAQNLWNNAFVNPQGVDMVKNLAVAWYDLSKRLTESSTWMGTLNGAFKMMAFFAGVVLKILPQIMYYLMISRAVKVWMGLVTQFQAACTWVAALRRQITATTAAQRGLNKAMKANIWGLIGSLIATAVVALSDFIFKEKEVEKESSKVDDALHEIGKSLSKVNAEVDRQHDKISGLISKIHDQNTAETERMKLIKRVKDMWSGYNVILDKQGRFISDNSNKLDDYIAKLRQAKIAELAEGKLEQALLDQQVAEYEKKRLNEERKKKKKAAAEQRKKDERDARKAHERETSSNARIGGREAKFMQMGDNISLSARLKAAAEKESHAIDDIDQKIDQKIKEINEALAVSNAEVEKWTEIQNAAAKKAEGIKLGAGETDEDDDEDDIRQQKQGQRERERSWREELKQKQDEANAIMDNVRNFYERQINEKLSQAIALGMDETEQNLFVEPVKRKMNIALAQVRLALAGQANTWDEIKETMSDDLIEKADETGVNLSEVLLQSIVDNDIDALRKKLSGLAESLGRPLNSVLAEIFAKATKNAQKNLDMEAKQAEMRRKITQENDYFAVVKQNMYDDFNQMGYANPTDTEISDKKAFDERKKSIIKMYEQARKELSQLYSIDVSTEQGRGLLMQMLFGDDEAKMGERIKVVLKDNEADWRTFYNKLIQYSNEYTEAEKRTYDRAKKIADQMWKINQRNIANQEKMRKMQTKASLFGKRTNFGSNLGLADLTADPEVELMKLKMQMAEDYYAFVFKNSKNQQLIDEADRARQEAELAYAKQMATAMKERLSQMQQFVNPIVDFGEATGKALAQMKDDAEGANEAIKSALKSMLEAWGKMLINDVNTQMWKGVNDAGAKRALKKAQPGIEEARNNADANAVKENLSNLGTAGNPMYVYVVNGKPVDENGNPVTAPLMATGNVVTNPDGTNGLLPAPAAGNGEAQWDLLANQDRSSVVFKDTANATGDAIADTTTGGSSFGEAAVGIARAGISEVMNTPIKKKKDRKDDVKEERKHQKELTQETKKGQKDREKETDRGMGAISDITKEGNSEQSKNTIEAQNLITNTTEAALNANLQKKQKVNDETLKSDAARTEGEVTFSIAGAIAKCFEFLGPIAGPIAGAVVMSTLMGLLQWALNSALGGSKNKTNTKAATKNTKLVSGMLTYDDGNVQDLKPFVSDKGDIYWATEDYGKHSGVSLLTQPTATTINGQPSLVAERGPELVIGRETTQAMMMNNPALLKALVNYDRNYSGRRAYDTGSVSQSVGNIADGASAADGTTEDGTPINAALLQAVNALLLTNNALVQRLNEPINAKIDMYGRGNLYDSMIKANQFMKSK